MRYTILLIAILAAARTAMAQPLRPPAIAGQDSGPAPIEGVGVDEHPSIQLPLDLTFEDELGKKVELCQFFQAGRPVVLQLGYYECPMLCGVVAQGLVRSLKDLPLKAGTDFTVLEISIDPKETPRLAYGKKQSYLAAYGRPGEDAGWHLLVGKEPAIAKVADAAGFRYKWVERAQQFAHPAVLIVCTPDGKISRYLYGVSFPSQTLRLSLVEASAGKIGTTTDRIMLTCFRYDPNTGRYTLAAINIMKGGAALTVVVLGLVLWRLFRRGSIAERQSPSTSTPSTP